MNASVRADSSRYAAGWAALAAICCAGLVVRPVFATPMLLAVFYVAMLLVGVGARSDRDREGLLPVVFTIAFGALVVAATRLLPGTALPVAGGVLAVTLNTLAAVAEEALFRRYLYGRLLRWGASAAILGSASLFALVHVPGYGLAALPVDFGAGLLLSWQRWASGRWETAAATHVFANVFATL